MNLTIKENINKESVVLKHKIALETITLLEGRENILYTEKALYTMVSFVDNFVEENLIDVINSQALDFASIVEQEIEPLFDNIVKKYEAKDLFNEIVEYVDDYLCNLEYKENTLFGFMNSIVDILSDMEWEDLKFFFNKVVTDARNNIAKENKPKVTQKEFDGASEKMTALINKFQKQKEELIKEKETKEEKENSNE